MILVLLVLVLGGALLGWLSDVSIMALAEHGFWLGLLGSSLCALTIVIAVLINAVATMRRVESTPWMLLSSLTNGYMIGAAAGLGYALGATAIGVPWLGVVFAILLATIVIVSSMLFIAWISAEAARSAAEMEYHSRPLIMDFDSEGRGIIYKRPY